MAIPSLGQLRYLSTVSNAAAVVGNSSSGIIEVPSFKVPTVNIGERQRGRLAAESVISCAPKTESIVEALNIALENDFSKVVNPYGKGQASKAILEVLMLADLSTMKRFHDI